MVTLQERRARERQHVRRERGARVGRERGGAALARAAHQRQRRLRAVQVRLAHQRRHLHQHLHRAAPALSRGSTITIISNKTFKVRRVYCVSRDTMHT